MSIKVTFEQGTGFSPRIVRIETTSTLSQVTTAGWLNSATREGLTIQPSDKVLVYYGIGATTGNAFFDVAIGAGTGIITLSVAESNVVLPVVSGDFAVFSGTSGALADLGYLPSDAAKTKVVMAGSAVQVGYIAHFVDVNGTVDDTAANVTNPGDISAGLSGTAGRLLSFPATAANGSFIISARNAGGAFNTTLRNSTMGQSTDYSIPDSVTATAQIVVAPAALVSGNMISASGTVGLIIDSGIVANRVLYTSFATPDVAADLISFDVTCGFAALATGGSVTLVTSSGSKQYKIRSLWINSGGTNFSGGGGDRLGQVTDGTTVYSVVPATNMQTLINGGWGISTVLPFPASAPANTSSVAGTSITFKYSGGTTDYTAGSVVISGIAQRVA